MRATPASFEWNERDEKNGGGNVSRWLFSSLLCHEIESFLFFPIVPSLSLSLFVVFHVSICFSIPCLPFLTLARKGAISVNDKKLGLRVNVLVFLFNSFSMGDSARGEILRVGWVTRAIPVYSRICRFLNLIFSQNVSINKLVELLRVKKVIGQE